METLTIGEVARKSGITVRTLHHYDEIGLLSPSGRAGNGYRLYDERDIDRLRDILTYRELGLSLGEIARAVDAPRGQVDTLIEARRRIGDHIAKLEAIVASLDTAIAADRRGINMSADEKLSVFGDFDPDEYAAEAEERWGGTDAYAEATRRTASYSAEDWAAINSEASAIYEGFAGLMRKGVAPTSSSARALVEDHRAHISQWFYDCTPEIHAGLGAMYVADARFTENIDKHGEGLAAYMSEAIAAAYV